MKKPASMKIKVGVMQEHMPVSPAECAKTAPSADIDQINLHTEINHE